MLGSLPFTLVGVVAVSLVIFLARMVTGLILRIVSIGIVLVILYFLYQAGAHQMMLAPGTPESEVLLNII